MPTESDYQELSELNARFSQTPAGKARRQYLDACDEIARLETNLEAARRAAAEAKKTFGEALADHTEDEALFLQIRNKAAQITFPRIPIVDDQVQPASQLPILEADQADRPSCPSVPPFFWLPSVQPLSSRKEVA